mmetsp:Transcript_61617/g.133383  ORF Transcript_61617/g.133383 Transcript_61617/m.133383 type:complete len:168 (+) Transcript_61617:552-1055(+)
MPAPTSAKEAQRPAGAAAGGTNAATITTNLPRFTMSALHPPLKALGTCTLSPHFSPKCSCLASVLMPLFAMSLSIVAQDPHLDAQGFNLLLTAAILPLCKASVLVTDEEHSFPGLSLGERVVPGRAKHAWPWMLHCPLAARWRGPAPASSANKVLLQGAQPFPTMVL